MYPQGVDTVPSIFCVIRYILPSVENAILIILLVVDLRSVSITPSYALGAPVALPP